MAISIAGYVGRQRRSAKISADVPIPMPRAAQFTLSSAAPSEFGHDETGFGGCHRQTEKVVDLACEYRACDAGRESDRDRMRHVPDQ
jgi:hypothetical protein